MTRTATYSPATIRRCETILKNARRQTVRTAVASVPTPAPAARKATPKAVKQDWRTRSASVPQMRRIHVLENALGYDLSPVGTFTAGEASDWYQTLKSAR